ncbi:MAG: DUF2911 domain-containing protein [Longimicrobiales bacterium]
MRKAGLGFLIGVSAMTSPIEAQTPRPSQHGTVSQTIHTTTITVEYDRPVARGRQLFGDDGIVVHDALWTPGANRATILELSAPARVAGEDVPAGRYGVWTIPGANEWTLILNRTWDTSHAIYPGPESEAMRTTIRTERGAHMETLAFYFPVVGPYSATLLLHWGEVIVPIPIEVER